MQKKLDNIDQQLMDIMQSAEIVVPTSKNGRPINV